MRRTHAVALSAIVAIGGWLALPAASHADRLLGAVERPTPIRAWGGIGAFSVHDSGAGVYRLAVTGPDGPPDARERRAADGPVRRRRRA